MCIHLGDEAENSKYQVITVEKRSKVQHQYLLTFVNSSKYLGIAMTTDLKWNQHIHNIFQEANNTLTFLRRNLRFNLPDLKATAYRALVRPLVE